MCIRDSSYTLFDIEKIPYAYKSPVYFRLPETTSPVWYKAIDSDVYPINADRITYPAVKSAHVIPSDVITPYARYGFNKIVTDIDASSPIVKSLSYLPEAEWPDKEYVCLLYTSRCVYETAHTHMGILSKPSEYVNMF